MNEQDKAEIETNKAFQESNLRFELLERTMKSFNKEWTEKEKIQCISSWIDIDTFEKMVECFEKVNKL